MEVGMKDRIKQIRKQASLTQVEFGERIGVKGNTITNYENGLRNPTDAVILSICREFNVNETWLRTGKGEMFIPEDMSYLYNVGKLASEKNEFKRFYLHMMMNLPDEYWDYIYNEFKKFSNKKEK